jgi:hypothetical protein
MKKSKMSKAKSGPTAVVAKEVLKSLLLMVLLLPVMLTLRAGHPLSYMIPNTLMFFGPATWIKGFWYMFLKYPDQPIPHDHVPVMMAEDFTYDAMRKLTNNWSTPAVVRGMFNGSPAVENWHKDGYLGAKEIGEQKIPVVLDGTYGTNQDNRVSKKFKDAFSDVVRDENSTNYLFFPVFSRYHFAGMEDVDQAAMEQAVNNVALEDLEFDQRIMKGFGQKGHLTFAGSQIIIGQGSDDPKATTGTQFHTEPGNNWFAMVHGHKRWLLMDGKQSPYMWPRRSGVHTNQEMLSVNVKDFHPYMPIHYADLYSGDLLYNPDWYWHSIINYGGLTIGCGVREFHLYFSLRNNLQYSLITGINRFLKRYGLDKHRYDLERSVMPEGSDPVDMM